MNLIINGEDRQFDSELTIAALLERLGMKPDRVAVELNRELVPRERWMGTRLANDDKLEIVHFVGGGVCEF
jgi:thiamine biosynthesis protein ThiS